MLRFIIVLCTLAFLCVNSHASVTVTVNGSNHTIPQTNEKGWGANVTAWIQAISAYTLQNSGGTFTLTAEVDTGATYGFKVPYIKTQTSTPSTAGVLRLARTDTIGWRNQADGANLLLGVDSSNRLTWNGSAIVSPTALTASRALASDASGVVSSTSVTSTELGYVSGVTSAIQTQIDGKISAANPTFSGTITTPLTASRAVVTGASSELAAATTTATEIGYVNGVTSAIQTQLDAKVAKSTLTAKGSIYAASASGTPAELAVGTNDYVLTAASGETTGLKWAAAPTALASSDDILNCSIAASVGSSNLTVALKDAAGSDPSAGSPCKISFRNATSATGTHSQVSTTGAVSTTATNGSSLGCQAASSACTVYVYAINNSGSVELGLIGQSMLDEMSIQSSTAEGGSGGADTPNTLYSTTARASKAVRLLARLTITPGGSFAWSAGPTEIANVPLRVPIISEWTSYTISIRGSGGNPTKASSPALDFARWRRVGDTMEIYYDYAQTATTGAANGTGVYIFSLPTGYTIDSNKALTSGAAGNGAVGSGTIYFGTSTLLCVSQIYDNSGVYLKCVNPSDASGVAIDAGAGSSTGFTNNATTRYGLKFAVPITGWGT